MTASSSFEASLRSALSSLGVDDPPSGSSAVVHLDGYEIWLSTEPIHNGVRPHEIHGAAAGLALVLRSRIYTFYRPPSPAVLDRIQAVARSRLPPPLALEHLAETASLYLRIDFTEPPSSEALLAAIRLAGQNSLLWLDEHLPALFD